MNGRVTLILVAFALLAGAYVFGIDRPQQAARAAREAGEDALVPLDRDDVRAFELPLADQEGSARVVRSRDPEGWRLEAPLQGTADTFAVDGLLTALLGLRSEVEIEDPPEDRGGFGLSAESRVVIVPEEGEPISLTLGGESPVGALRYVEISTRPGTVHGVSRAKIDALEPPLFTLRDKSMVRLEPTEVSEIEVARRDGLQVKLVRRSEAEDVVPPDGDTRFKGESAWQLVAPIEDQADAERTNQLIQDFYFARAEGILDAPDLASNRYGLARPAARLRFATRGGESAEIVLGSVDEATFARVDGAGPVFEVPGRLLEVVPGALFDYRFKRVLAIRRRDVAALEIDFPRQQREFHFVESADSGWEPAAGPGPVAGEGSTGSEGGVGGQEAAPEEVPDRVIRSVRLEDVIQASEFIRATAVLDAPDLKALGLDPPAVRIAYVRKDGRPIGWLELGTPEPQRGVPARSSVSERVWILSGDATERFPIDLETFEESWWAEPEPAPEAGGDEPDAPSEPPGDASEAPPGPGDPPDAGAPTAAPSSP